MVRSDLCWRQGGIITRRLGPGGGTVRARAFRVDSGFAFRDCVFGLRVAVFYGFNSSADPSAGLGSRVEPGAITGAARVRKTTLSLRRGFVKFVFRILKMAQSDDGDDGVDTLDPERLKWFLISLLLHAGTFGNPTRRSRQPTKGPAVERVFGGR